MLHMEVDLHSPPFRTMRSFTGNSSKRPRSPEGSPLGEFRPSKRLALSIASNDALGGFPSPASAGSAHTHTRVGGYASGACSSASAGSSRYPSEDWVRQADGLSIESPGSDSMGSKITKQLQDDDVHMNTDPDENTAVHDHQRPELPPIQTSTAAYPSFAQVTLQRQPNQQSQRHLSPAFASHPMTTITPTGPAVNVLPPTPIPPPQQFLGAAASPYPTRPSTPVSNSPMSLSSPMSSDSNVISPRKQRFTMGPRSDCEKCRLGIKGHWVHY